MVARQWSDADLPVINKTISLTLIRIINKNTNN